MIKFLSGNYCGPYKSEHENPSDVGNGKTALAYQLRPGPRYANHRWYKVVLLTDDYTPMEFRGQGSGMAVLFRAVSRQGRPRIMLHVHIFTRVRGVARGFIPTETWPNSKVGHR